MSYPNQKKIIINKPKYNDTYVDEKGAFLQIGIDEWTEAFKRYKDLPASLALYLYLASNANGYEKWLSPEAYSNATGMSRSSYYRAMKVLKNDGFIYEDNCGRLNYATKPKEGLRKAIQEWDKTESEMRQQRSTLETEKSHSGDKSVSSENREINSIDKINKNREIDNSSSTDFSYLKDEVDCDGNFDGTSFEEIIPRFEKVADYFKVKRIADNTRFSEDEAEYIVYEILSDKWRTDHLLSWAR